MTKLATVTVGSGGSSSIEFTNIPQTYTDLKILLSIKEASTSSSGATYIDVRLNGSTGTYAIRRVVGFGSSITSNTAQTSGFMSIGYFNNSRTTMADMFTNAELYFANYTGANYKTVSCEFSMPDNTTTGPYTGFGAGIWENTSAINSILIRADGFNLTQYSEATLYGIRNMRRAAGNSIKATGGNISFDGTYVVHTFNSSGTFTPTVGLTADYLVVAGGGGAEWGGGGAGGLLTSIGGTALSLSSQPYTVTVGAGGAAGATSGSSSSISTTSSTGGGFGATGSVAGANGGSGGGGSINRQSNNTLNFQFAAGLASPSGQGNNGGSPTVVDLPTQSSRTLGGGGGGAGGTGGSGANKTGGNGGIGILSSISGTSNYYAGGGGGTAYSLDSGTDTPGTGGAGGGGNGGTYFTSGTTGRPNTGGGGGSGQAGGSGIVIIRYKA